MCSFTCSNMIPKTQHQFCGKKEKKISPEINVPLVSHTSYNYWESYPHHLISNISPNPENYLHPVSHNSLWNTNLPINTFTSYYLIYIRLKTTHQSYSWVYVSTVYITFTL